MEPATSPLSERFPIIDCFVNLGLSGALEAPMAREALRDEESLASWPGFDVVKHLFKADAGKAERYEIAKSLERWLEHQAQWGVTKVQLAMTPETPNEIFDQISEHPDKLFVSLRHNPHDGMPGLRRLTELATRYPMIRSVSMTPHFFYPFIAPSSKEYYPVYAKAIELDLAVYMNVGFPGPRVPAATQDPMHLDEVCWFFPDLRVVMRHGGEPWTDVCVKLMLRWPNLYFATTAFAPKYYPRDILQFANTRGHNKLIFAGYFPTLGYDRVLKELEDLPLRDEVWPRFLHDNAVEAFRL